MLTNGAGSGLDEIEAYLESARILDIAHFEKHGAHRSHRIILEGGVGVLSKPADTVQLGEVVCEREAAAWALARALGWTDLLAATALRRMPSPDSGNEVLTSFQILWPDVLPDADPGVFPDQDIWRAGIFDAMISHEDRNGHNWLAVPGSGSAPRLKLVDHGFGFPETVTPPNSTFYELRKGQDIPDDCVETLDRLRPNALRGRLSDAASDALAQRVEALVSTRVLEIKPP